MTTNHHTDIPYHSARTTAVLNAPLGQLDAAISNVALGVSVRDHGAVGDGVTDDTTAVVAARTAGRITGAAVLFPPGTYVVDQQTITSGESWIGTAGHSVIRRVTGAATGVFIAVTAPTFAADGLVFDGNGAGNACHTVYLGSGNTDARFSRCRFTGGRKVAGYGAGASVDTGNPAGQVCSFLDCEFHDNDGDGLSVLSAEGLSVSGGWSHDNGDGGIVLNNFDITLSRQITAATIRGVRINGNGGDGITAGNILNDNDLGASPLDYGHDDPEVIDLVIADCDIWGNDQYGIACAAQRALISGGRTAGNGVAGSAVFGGILACGAYIKIVGVDVNSNHSFGIDGGASDHLTITGCTVEGNSSGGSDISVCGVNLEGSRYALVAGNHFIENGDDYQAQISVERVGADANAVGFPDLTQYISIIGNRFSCSSARVGIVVTGGVDDISIIGNDFDVTAQDRAVRAIADTIVIRDNRLSGNLVGGSTEAAWDAGTGTLSIPDVEDEAVWALAGGETVQGVRYYTATTVVGKGGVGWVDVTNGGSGYTSAPTVGFSGGGGSGAAATAFLHGGAVRGVRMTGYGTGYTSAPTVGFTGGGGSAAAGTAVLSVPVPVGRELQLQLQLGVTLKRGGTVGPVIESPSGADITVPEHGFVRLRGAYSRWQLVTKNF